MRGHEDLIRLRLQGAKPEGLVFVDDYPVKRECARWIEEDTAPSICTDGDQIATLDLRFLVGLRVAVHGSSLKRVRALSAACRKAGAEFVIATCGDRIAVWKQGEAKWRSS